MNMSTVTPTLEQMINIKLDERNNENKHMDAMLNVKNMEIRICIICIIYRM